MRSQGQVVAPLAVLVGLFLMACSEDAPLSPRPQDAPTAAPVDTVAFCPPETLATQGPTQEPAQEPVDCPFSDDSCETFRLVNELRERGGACEGEAMPPVSALTWSAQAGSLAVLWASDERSLQGHGDFSGRVRPTLAAGQAAGENIYVSSPDYSPADAVQGWVSSPGHCRNMHNPLWTEAGLAVRQHGPWVAVQVFLGRVSPAGKPAALIFQQGEWDREDINKCREAGGRWLNYGGGLAKCAGYAPPPPPEPEPDPEPEPEPEPEPDLVAPFPFGKVFTDFNWSREDINKCREAGGRWLNYGGGLAKCAEIKGYRPGHATKPGPRPESEEVDLLESTTAPEGNGHDCCYPCTPEGNFDAYEAKLMCGESCGDLAGYLAVVYGYPEKTTCESMSCEFRGGAPID